MKFTEAHQLNRCHQPPPAASHWQPVHFSRFEIVLATLRNQSVPTAAVDMFDAGATVDALKCTPRDTVTSVFSRDNSNALNGAGMGKASETSPREMRMKNEMKLARAYIELTMRHNCITFILNDFLANVISFALATPLPLRFHRTELRWKREKLAKRTS